MGISAERVVSTIKEIIDEYWKGNMSEAEASQEIQRIMLDPKKRIKVKRAEQYTAVFKSRMGKKRLETFEALYKDL